MTALDITQDCCCRRHWRWDGYSLRWVIYAQHRLETISKSGRIALLSYQAGHKCAGVGSRLVGGHWQSGILGLASLRVPCKHGDSAMLCEGRRTGGCMAAATLMPW